MTKFYHITWKKNVAGILKDGLRPGRDLTYTNPAAAVFWSEIYPCWPIFISIGRPWSGDFIVEPHEILLEVQVPAHATVMADMPSLVDKNAYAMENGMFWDDYDLPPKPLRKFQDNDGEISYDSLMNHPPTVRAAMASTRTFATCTRIPAENLKIAAAYYRRR